MKNLRDYSIRVLTEFDVFANFPGKNGPRRKQPERFFQNHLQVFESKHVVGSDVAITVSQHAVNLVVNSLLKNRQTVSIINGDEKRKTCRQTEFYLDILMHC